MNSAIGYAHFQLAGGVRTVLRWCVAFVLVATVGMSIYARYGGGGTTAAMATSVTPAMIIVGVLLGILVNGRIATAMKLDNSIEMARSHRLMAVGAGGAVFGYMFGPSLAVLSAAGLAALYAAAGFVAGQYDLAMWAAAMVILAMFSAVLWSLTVMSGLSGKGGGSGWLWGVSAGAFFGTGGGIFAAAPFVLTLITPFGGDTIFQMRTVDQLSVGHAMGLFAQAILFALFVCAAMRRWRRSDRPALSPGMWLALAVLFVAGTLAGVHWFESLRPPANVGLVPSPGMTLPVTLTLLVVLAHGPIASAEFQAAAWRLRKNVDDPAADDDRPTLPAWAAATLMFVILAPLGLLVPEHPFGSTFNSELVLATTPAGGEIKPSEATLLRHAWPITAAAVAAGLATAWALMRLLIRLRMARYTFWVYLLLWGVPLGLSFATTLWLTGELDGSLLPMAAASLPGALFHAWGAGEGSAWPGVAAQWIVAATLAVFALRASDRVARPATREPPPALAGAGMATPVAGG